jgi:hypothetical protein
MAYRIAPVKVTVVVVVVVVVDGDNEDEDEDEDGDGHELFCNNECGDCGNVLIELKREISVEEIIHGQRRKHGVGISVSSFSVYFSFSSLLFSFGLRQSLVGLHFLQDIVMK